MAHSAVCYTFAKNKQMKKLLLLLLFPVYCLAQVPAYYSAVDFSLTGEPLKAELSQLVTTTQTYNMPYSEVWNALKQTDLDPANPENVLLIYGFNDGDMATNNDRTRDKDLSCHVSSCTGLWVREHTFAQSLGDPQLGTVGAGSDPHHLRAIDSQMNNSRSNRSFADGSGTAVPLAGGLWYPGDEWKGDVARMMMYMYLRYQSQCEPVDVGSGSTSYSPLGDMPNIFLEWNQEDPVSQYEMNRNLILQGLMGNRNPFIDNPYLATMIWGGPQATDTWGLLGTEETELDRLVVYPTLTSGAVTVDSPVYGDFSYIAYNSVGQQVNIAINRNTIDFGSNASGIYFLNITDGSRVKSVRIIKQ